MRHLLSVAVFVSLAAIGPAHASQPKRPHLTHKAKPKAKLHVRADYDNYRAQQRAAYTAKQAKLRAHEERRLARAGI